MSFNSLILSFHWKSRVSMVPWWISSLKFLYKYFENLFLNTTLFLFSGILLLKLKVSLIFVKKDLSAFIATIHGTVISMLYLIFTVLSKYFENLNSNIPLFLFSGILLWKLKDTLNLVKTRTSAIILFLHDINRFTLHFSCKM